VVGLGGNALLRKGEPLTHEAQLENVAGAAAALGGLAREHEIVVTHGNGPQVGLLALQDQATPGSGDFPLDVLNAETEGMIGYLLAQEIRNVLPERRVATILTQVVVDPDDPAFGEPTKPVPSPLPLRVLEIDSIRLLVDAGTIVVCAGGGGIPVAFDASGRARGVEAVIDKDRATALLAVELDADALILLTDVAGIFEEWGTPSARQVGAVTPEDLAVLELPAGSMRPKAEAAADFVRRTGGIAGIGAIEDAEAIVRGEAGTVVRSRVDTSTPAV
jgi:carbamate kinase